MARMIKNLSEAMKDFSYSIALMGPYFYSKYKITHNSDESLPCTNLYNLVGTEFVDGIVEIQFARALWHLLGMKQGVYHDYIIPAVFAVYNTLLEFNQFYNLIDFDDKSRNFDLDNTPYYWGAAAITVFGPKIYKTVKRKITRKG